jgi:DNA-binding IclR family transcriptional regulator
MNVRSHQETEDPQVLDMTLDASVVERVRAEFAEMRGFSPTLTQAARLFDLPTAKCLRVLERLVDERVLHLTPDGCYRLFAE